MADIHVPFAASGSAAAAASAGYTAPTDIVLSCSSIGAQVYASTLTHYYASANGLREDEPAVVRAAARMGVRIKGGGGGDAAGSGSAAGQRVRLPVSLAYPTRTAVRNSVLGPGHEAQQLLLQDAQWAKPGFLREVRGGGGAHYSASVVVNTRFDVSASIFFFLLLFVNLLPFHLPPP